MNNNCNIQRRGVAIPVRADLSLPRWKEDFADKVRTHCLTRHASAINTLCASVSAAVQTGDNVTEYFFEPVPSVAIRCRAEWNGSVVRYVAALMKRLNAGWRLEFMGDQLLCISMV